MSRYSALKAIINQDITTNGQGDITGAILNQVLKDMVDSLGAYFQFGGIATPTTNPGNPDQRVFYIATIAGTYTNFDSMAVPNGISILKFDESWSLQTLDLSTYLNNVVADGVVDGTRISATTTTSDRKTPDAYSAGSVFTYYDSTNDTTYYYVALTNGTAGTSCSDPTKFFATTSSTQAVYQAMLISSVIATEPQSFSPMQKEQAAANIGLGVVVKGDVQQSFSDNEQVQAQNNIVGKVYDAATFSGLGKKVLAKNIQTVGGVQKNVMTQAFFQDSQGNDLENTVFLIQFNYTLGANITIPAGCTLEFDGGSITGAGTGKNTITGAATILQADELTIFNAIKIAGTWNVPDIYSKWFTDIQSENGIRNLTALSDDSIYNVIHVAPGTYLVSVSERGEAGLILKSNTELILDGTISMVGNAFQSYQVVLCEAVSNVYIHGSGGILGDLATHDVTQFEYCHGLYFGVGSSNLKVSGINISQCPGEGVYIGGRSTTIPKNITVENCTISNIGRNGISIDYCDGYRITGNHITNVTINPGAGIFIEPIEQSTHVEKSLNGEIGSNFISGCRHSIRLEHADITWAEIAAITGETVPAGHENDLIPLIDNVDIHDNYFDGGISYCVYISNGANIKLRSNYVNRKCLIKKATVFSNTFDFTDDTMTVVFNNLLAYNNQFNCNFPSIDKIPIELGGAVFENNRIVNNGTYRVYSFISIASGYSRVADNTFEGNARTAFYLYGANSDGISMNNKYSPSIGVANPSGNAPFVIGLPVYNAVGTVRPNVHQQYYGLMFYDKTINKPIYYDGNNWIDSMGNTIT